MKKFSTVLQGAGVLIQRVEGDSDIRGVTAFSGAVRPGELFLSMPSASGRAGQYLADALGRHPSAVVVHSEEAFRSVHSRGIAAALLTPEALLSSSWKICREVYGSVTADMKAIAVTGTNGKTTVAWLMRDMLAQMGENAAYLGTLGFQTPQASVSLDNTTPFAPQLYELLDGARNSGVTALAMEVSSHALAEHRVDGIEFDAGVFTNLTQDHLDFHGSLEAYAESKFRLFSEMPGQSAKPFVAVLNMDDPVGVAWSHRVKTRTFLFGRSGRDLQGSADNVHISSMELRLKTNSEERLVNVPLGGEFNVKNCIAATAGLLAIGKPLEEIAEALSHARPVPGRFEPVQNDKGISVIVDYAHTPDALEKLLESVRALSPRRIWTVFGCGGNRDRTKRPLMARTVSERSDVTIITSDNPRQEDPLQILHEVEQGLVRNATAKTIVDRREAIAYSIRSAEPGDVVVIAGKGHEDYQIIGTEKQHLDDREVAREVLSV